MHWVSSLFNQELFCNS